jgi:hypothetical protein
VSNDFDDLLGHRRDPEPSQPETAPIATTSRSRRRALPWVVVGVVLLLLVGGGVAFAFFGPGNSDATAPTTSSSPSPSDSPSAEPSPDPEAPGSTALPTACVDIFSPTYHAELAATGAVLSEGNTGPREHPLRDGEVPAVVEATIAAAPHLECSWTFADNFNVGINTAVAQVTEEQAAEVTQALDGADFTAVPELGSTRYITEIAGTDGFGPHGYSIIARDGMLIATEWLDWPAAGYTADIVNTVLGPAE